MKKNVVHRVTFFLCLILLSEAATNSQQFNIRGVVHLYSYGRRFGCSGNIVGIDPVKVVTAAHCLGNLKDGDIEMVDPTVEEDNPFRPQRNYIKSREVFVAENPAFVENLSQSIKTHTQIYELKAQLKSHLYERQDLLQIRKNLLNELRKITEESAKQSSYKDLAINNERQETLDEQISEENQSLEKLQKDFSDYFSKAVNPEQGTAHLDLALVVFEDNFTIPMKDVLDLVKRSRVLPLATQDIVSPTKAFLGGYGLISDKIINDSTLPSLTMNQVSPLADIPHVYSAKGMLTAFLQTQKIAKGEYGTPMLGDSGGPALTEFGLSGILSVMNEGKLIEPLPPKEGWPNSRRANKSYWDEYEAQNTAYVSMTSDDARNIFKRAESAYGSLVYMKPEFSYKEQFADISKRFLDFAASSSSLFLNSKDLLVAPPVLIQQGNFQIPGSQLFPPVFK